MYIWRLMNYIKTSLIAGMLLLFISASGNAQVPPGKVNSSMLEESINAVIGEGGDVQWTTMGLKKEFMQSIEKELKLKNRLPDSVYVGRMNHKGSSYYIIPDNAPSKSEMFSYVLYLDTDKKIVDVDVLEYRENYGYEIDYSFFRKQFHDKEKARNIRFNRTIQNISGATISARNITNAVHDLMLIIKGLELS